MELPCQDNQGNPPPPPPPPSWEKDKSCSDARFAAKEPLSERRLRYAKQIGMFFAATIGHLNLGMSLSWPNTLASDLQTNNSTFLGSQLQLLDWEMDMTSSMAFIGTLPGFLIGGWLVARIGRRKSMMVVTIPGTIGWTLIFLAINSPMILVGRFSIGVAYAFLGVAVRTYLVEISDTSIRGAAGLFPEIMKGAGGIVIVALGMAIPWYYLALVCIVHIALYGLVVVPFFPESPTYLVVREREEEARKVLLYLKGPYADLEEEIRQLKEKNQPTAASSDWAALLRVDVIKKCLVVFGLFLISNFCGTEVIRANALRMLQTSGLSLDKDLSTIFVLTFLLTGIVSQVFLIDRFGRRKCLVLSLILIMVAYTVLGTYVFLDSPVIDLIPLVSEGNTTTSHTEISPWSWLPTVCLMVAAFGINLGIGPIPWMLSVEYFPTNIRSQVMGVCNFVGNMFSFVTLQLYSPLQDLLTPAGLYWSYACFAAFGIVYTFVAVTETKGRKIG